MSFWKSDRYEYVRQPHILALLAIGLIVLVGALYTGISRLQDQQRRSTLPADVACMELVSDEALCRFAAASEESASLSYKSVTTTVSGTETTVVFTEYENPDRISMLTQVNGQETDAFMLLDADNYARDYSDGMWAHYRDEGFEATAATAQSFDFSSEFSADVMEFRDNYVRMGTEPCDDRTCYKYRISSSEDTTQDLYIWFDDVDYLIRRYEITNEQAASTTQYTYSPVKLTAPATVKELDEEAFTALIE